MPAPTVATAHRTLIQAFEDWGAGDPSSYHQWRTEHDRAHLLELRRRLPLWQDAVARLPLAALQDLWDEPEGAWQAEVAPWPLVHEFAWPLVHEFAAAQGSAPDALWRWVGGLGIDLNACRFEGGQVEKTHSWSWPPVVQAFLRCDGASCDALLAAGADLFAPLTDGRTVLHLLFEGSGVEEFTTANPCRSLWGARNTFGTKSAQARLSFWLPRLASEPQALFRLDRAGRSPLRMAAALTHDDHVPDLRRFLEALLAPVPVSDRKRWMEAEGRLSGAWWAPWPAQLLKRQGNLDLWFRLVEWGLPPNLVDATGTSTLGHLVKEAASWKSLPAVGPAFSALQEAGFSEWGWEGASVWTPLLESGDLPNSQLMDALTPVVGLEHHRWASKEEPDLLVGLMQAMKKEGPQGRRLQHFAASGVHLLQNGLPFSEAAALFLSRVPKGNRAMFAPFQDFQLALDFNQRLPRGTSPCRPRM